MANQTRRRHEASPENGNGTREPPHDDDAERTYLGTLLLHGGEDPRGAGLIGAEHLYRPNNQTIFAAVHALVAEGVKPEPVLVADQLDTWGMLEQCGGLAGLLDMQMAGSVLSLLPRYARIIVRHSRARQAIAAAYDIAAAAWDGDLESVHQRVAASSAALLAPLGVAAEPDENVDVFCGGDDPAHDWLIPDLIERGDRFVLTGGEGGGKSTLLLQMAVQAAAGIHPFTLAEVEPLSVLVVDLENSRRQLRRRLRPLRLKAGSRLAPDRLRVLCKPDGVDLLNADQAAWLAERAMVDEPDIVIVGPLYKMGSGDPNRDEFAAPVAFRLDQIRVRANCAVFIEAHQPHAASGSSHRPERPIGSSLWMRWPEFGMTIDAQGRLRHWRGQRDQRAWPSALVRGGQWPWSPGASTPSTSTAEEYKPVGPEAIEQAAGAVREVLAAVAPQWANTSDLRTKLRAVGHRFSNTLIREACAELVAVGEVLVSTGARGAVLYRLGGEGENEPF